MAAFKLMTTLVIFVVVVKCNTSGNSVESDLSEEKELQKLQEENHDGPWSVWSEWSPCSRTCDGGTAFQLRRCNHVTGCTGSTVRYRICNMQPCPDTVDFREHQCRAYNEVPYDGELLQWTAYYEEGEDPCQLKCRSHNGLIATLAPSVQDGTRCRPGSLDLCVDGKCQRVGCDLVIGSEAKVDACGVCGGDGSSCIQPLYHWVVESASLCSATCGTGYKMSQVVCRNVVTGSNVDPQLCDASQQPEGQMIECNTHPCPAKWVAESWSRCSVSCGGGTRSRLVTCMRQINSTFTKVPEHQCKGPKVREIEPCNNMPCPPTWVVGPWSGCSVSCGEGAQTRNVTCKLSQFLEPSSSSCDESIKPDITQPCTTGIPCNTENSESVPEIEDTIRILHPYPPFRPVAERLIGEQIVSSSLPSSEPNYKPEAWGDCSVTCGEGFRKREVPCTIFLEFSRTFARLTDSHCQGTKPPTTERCIEPPCPLGNRMDAIRDGYSDATYADPYRSQYSESAIRVAPHRTGKTYTWKTQGYTHCSASCLGGVQESLIMCVQEDDQKVVSPFLCDSETRPEALTRTCNDHPCPPRWNHSDFQPCSKACGIGMQTREVNCIHEVTRGGGNTVIVPNHMCPQPPPTDRQYCNVLDCPVNWQTSAWSKCSKRCGAGVKSRTVECKQIMAQNHVVSRPISQCPKSRPPERRPCNTKPCPSEDQRPPIIAANQSYTQSNPTKRKVALKIGGTAQVFHGTQIKIKCPVKKFDRSKIQWAKDHKLITSSKKYKISKKGALRIQEVSYGDTGVFTCLAGRSSADITINVKARPGEFPSSEEIEKHTNNQLDPAMHNNGEPAQRPFVVPGDDESHEQRPSEMLPPRRQRPTPPSQLHQEKPSNVRPQQQSQSTTNSHIDQTELGSTSEDPLQYEPPTSAGSRPLPHFHQLISNLQNFGNSRGHRMVMEEALEHEAITSDDENIEESTTEDSQGHIVVLGKGSPENLKFEWVLTNWSACSQSCGGQGFQMRTAHCIVGLHNNTQSVDRNLCIDAEQAMPPTVQQCGSSPCPQWAPSSWQPCHQSRCFTYNTAMQRREIECNLWNGTTTEPSQCDELTKPTSRQECYNDKCKGTWRVGDWSECTGGCDAQGVKYRILQCVWYGTKKPAGNACRDNPRPPVMKTCRGPPCSDDSECKDYSKYCRNIRTMNMCRMYRYQLQCCQSCSSNKKH